MKKVVNDSPNDALANGVNVNAIVTFYGVGNNILKA